MDGDYTRKLSTSLGAASFDKLKVSGEKEPKLKNNIEQKTSEVLKPIFSDINNLKSQKKEISNQIKLVEEQKKEFENLNAEKFSDQIEKLSEVSKLLKQQKKNIKNYIADLREKGEALATNLEVAFDEESKEMQAEIEQNEYLKVGDSYTKEAEQHFGKSTELLRESENHAAQAEQAGEEKVQYLQEAEDFEALKEAKELDAVYFEHEIDKSGFDNIYRLRNKILEQQRTPTNDKEWDDMKEFIRSGEAIFLKGDTLKASEKVAAKFEPGKVPVRFANGKMGHKKIKNIEIFTPEELKAFQKSFTDYAIKSWQQGQQSQLAGSQEQRPEKELTASQPQRSDTGRTTTKHDRVSKEETEKKESVKTSSARTEQLAHQKKIEEDANLRKRREGIEKKKQTIRKFIDKWNKNDANLQFDLEKNDILQEYVKRHNIKPDVIKLEYVRVVLNKEIDILDKELQKIDKKIERIQVSLTKPRNLKSSV